MLDQGISDPPGGHKKKKKEEEDPMPAEENKAVIRRLFEAMTAEQGMEEGIRQAMAQQQAS